MAETAATAPKLLFTVTEAATRLGAGRTTLYGLVADRAITPVHVGRLTRFTADELEASSPVSPTKPA